MHSTPYTANTLAGCSLRISTLASSLPTKYAANVVNRNHEALRSFMPPNCIAKRMVKLHTPTWAPTYRNCANTPKVNRLLRHSRDRLWPRLAVFLLLG